jgi:GntR family transcriptional regulator
MHLPALDRTSVVPLYYQIQERLLKMIHDGLLKPGAPTPSEQELASRLGVSRMTARQALKALRDSGMAYARRGKGTYVSDAKVEKNFRQVLSFSEEMKSLGARPSSRVLYMKSIPADPETAEALAISPGEPVVVLRRVRQADALPLGVETSHLPQSMCPDLLAKFDPAQSLYKALFELYGIQIEVTDEVAEAGLAGEEDGRLLGIGKRSPVFLLTRISYVAGGRRVEFVRSMYRGDRYKIVNRLVRRASAGASG